MIERQLFDALARRSNRVFHTRTFDPLQRDERSYSHAGVGIESDYNSMVWKFTIKLPSGRFRLQRFAVNFPHYTYSWVLSAEYRRPTEEEFVELLLRLS